MPDEVVLSIAGKKYAGWTEARIQRGIEQVSGQFSLTVSDRWPGQETAWPIRPGDACTLSVDGAVVITGHVDDVFPQFDANGHAIQVYGRDAVGDLIDCSAALRPGRWENRTLTQIAADICRPFGIAVAATADVGPVFSVFAVQPGESAFEAIERACRFRGVLPVSDGRGGLLLTGPSAERLAVALVQGENILAASAALSSRDRFSAYTALGQSAGSDSSTPDQNASPAGRATDPGVTRHRAHPPGRMGSRRAARALQSRSRHRARLEPPGRRVGAQPARAGARALATARCRAADRLGAPAARCVGHADRNRSVPAGGLDAIADQRSCGG